MFYKIKLNLYYIKIRSFWSDMFLIVVIFLKMINKIEDKSIVKDE